MHHSKWTPRTAARFVLILFCLFVSLARSFARVRRLVQASNGDCNSDKSFIVSSERGLVSASVLGLLTKRDNNKQTYCKRAYFQYKTNMRPLHLSPSLHPQQFSLSHFISVLLNCTLTKLTLSKNISDNTLYSHQDDRTQNRPRIQVVTLYS